MGSGYTKGVEVESLPDNAQEIIYFRFLTIESDCRLNIFGEIFLTPPETWHEYVVATIDVKEQELKLFLGAIQVEEYDYRL